MGDRSEQISIASPKGIDPCKVPGGTPDLTAEDIAGAMGAGHLTRLQSDILLYKYAGLGHPSTIFGAVLNDVANQHRDWFGEGQVEDLVRRVVAEFLSPNRCPKCKGTEIDRDAHGNPLPQLCSQCNGTGHWYEPMSLHGVWRARYERLLDRMRDIEQEALARMR